MAKGQHSGGRLRILWSVYQHVASVLAIIGLAAVLNHVFHIEWRSVLGTVVGYWDEIVRPVAKVLLDHLIVVPLGWVGWHIELPVLLRDYLTIGLILMVSFVRAAARAVSASISDERDTDSEAQDPGNRPLGA